jgi:hypothetical protein
MGHTRYRLCGGTNWLGVIASKEITPSEDWLYPNTSRATIAAKGFKALLANREIVPRIGRQTYSLFAVGNRRPIPREIQSTICQDGGREFGSNLFARIFRTQLEAYRVSSPSR